MKDRRPRNPLKHYSLIFLSISALGLTSSWLSSCSDTSAATTADHSNIEARLVRIEAKLGSPNDGSGNVSTMADLVSKLSDDIGLMADRIVETEYLIVSVITSQTAAALTVINGAQRKDPLNPDNLLPVYEGPKPIKFVLEDILTSHSGGANGVLLSTQPQVSPVSLSNAPNLNFVGINSPYLLQISKSGIFGGVDSTSEIIDVNNLLNSGWSAMLSRLIINNGDKVFIAVKTVVGGQFSPASNTINVIVP